MARYSWAGRSASGSSVTGVLEAPSREAVLAKLETLGIAVTRVEESAGHEESLAPGGAPGPRPGQTLREKTFTAAVVLASTAISVGVAWFVPVLRYECRREVSGAVRCRIGRSVFGLLPIEPVDTPRILSVSVETVTHSQTTRERSRGKRPSQSERLVLIGPGGPCWSSSSSWPMGDSNDEIAGGIRALLELREPPEFSAWQAEKVTLIVEAAFLVPLALALLALVVRLTIGQELVREKAEELAAKVSRRRER